MAEVRHLIVKFVFLRQKNILISNVEYRSKAFKTLGTMFLTLGTLDHFRQFRHFDLRHFK